MAEGSQRKSELPSLYPQFLSAVLKQLPVVQTLKFQKQQWWYFLPLTVPPLDTAEAKEEGMINQERH